jgi:hypothetical protein
LHVISNSCCLGDGNLDDEMLQLLRHYTRLFDIAAEEHLYSSVSVHACALYTGALVSQDVAIRIHSEKAIAS